MPTIFKTCTPYLALPILGTLLLTLTSCDISFDPSKTVVVEITKITDKNIHDEIKETLKGMTEGSSHIMVSCSSEDKMTVKLSPIKDLKAFSRKINFGEVTEIDGRTIKVEFVN